VLPFVNLSGDVSQDYFSDGLTEELLNSLAEIEGLQVAARTSSFSFREHPDIATVAHKLNVGAALEGSVRRSANTVRVSAQLINTVTGFHLWAKTYDRDLGYRPRRLRLSHGLDPEATYEPPPKRPLTIAEADIGLGCNAARAFRNEGAARGAALS
jgi:hypothetical protein